MVIAAFVKIIAANHSSVVQASVFVNESSVEQLEVSSTPPLVFVYLASFLSLHSFLFYVSQ